MSGKRPDKIKLEVGRPPSALKFTDNLGEGKRGVSLYAMKLLEALNIDGAIKIKLDDSYMRAQLRARAKKLCLKLLFSPDGEFLWVKPIRVDGQAKRLLLYLREPRTRPELETIRAKQQIEIDLEAELERQLKDGVIEINHGAFRLTAKGKEMVA